MIIRILLVLILSALAGPAFAWPYEVYPAPRDLAAWRVDTTIELADGRAELLIDSRITPANRAKVRTILAGGDAGDAALQDAFDREDPRYAVVRFHPKGGGSDDLVVLDNALATLAPIDLEGDGRVRLEVTIDTLQAHRGRLTLFIDAVKGKLQPVQFLDAADGYRMQIELIDTARAWWKREAGAYLAVDSRFSDRTDLMSIRWENGQWVRRMKLLPPGAVPAFDRFPQASAFP